MDTLPSGNRSRGDLELAEGIMLNLRMAWSRLGIPLAELLLVVIDWDAWRSQLELLLLQPQKDKWAKRYALNYFTVFPKKKRDKSYSNYDDTNPPF